MPVNERHGTTRRSQKIHYSRKNLKYNIRQCVNNNKYGNNNSNRMSLKARATAVLQKMFMSTAAAARKKTIKADLATALRCTTVSILSATATTQQRTTKFRMLPSLGATSFFTLLTLVCLETVLLSTVSNCAKTFYMHWNTSNSIFRIDNTDHIIDVNKGNLAFEFDQVHIICPVYEPGTYENETEKYIIYNVSKVEYETCRITNADPRVIAICDKPQKLMFFTITFRPFTPQPGGLEFLPGNDYYFISTSSKDDLYRRIGGRCSTNNMKVVFKVCCAPEEKNKTTTTSINNSGSSTSSGVSSSGGSGENINAGGGGGGDGININTATNMNQQHHINNINTIGINGVNTGMIPGSGGININNAGVNTGMQLKPINAGGVGSTSINTNIDQFNRVPIQPNAINVLGNNIGVGGGVGLGNHGVGGIMLTPGHGGINMIPTGGNIGQYPGHIGQSGIRINNVASQQHYPSNKNGNNNNNNNDEHYDKHPNEVVKNEELTYNSAATTLHQRFSWKFASILKAVTIPFKLFISTTITEVATSFTATCSSNMEYIFKFINNKKHSENLFLHLRLKKTMHCIIKNFNPIILFTILLITCIHFIFKYTLEFSTTHLTSVAYANIYKSTQSSYKSSINTRKLANLSSKPNVENLR